MRLFASIVIMMMPMAMVVCVSGHGTFSELLISPVAFRGFLRAGLTKPAQCLTFHLWQCLSWVVLSAGTPRATPLVSKPVQLAKALLASAVKSFLCPEFPAPA